MSRHLHKQSNIEIAYGFDDIPGGGYFFQVFDKNAITEENEEGIILNEGFTQGISQTRMLELMVSHDIKNEVHLKRVAMNMQI